METWRPSLEGFHADMVNIKELPETFRDEIIIKQLERKSNRAEGKIINLLTGQQLRSYHLQGGNFNQNDDFYK